MADSGDSRIHPFIGELFVEMMRPKQFSAIYRSPKYPAGFDTPLSIPNCLEVAPADRVPTPAHNHVDIRQFSHA